QNGNILKKLKLNLIFLYYFLVNIYFVFFINLEISTASPIKNIIHIEASMFKLFKYPVFPKLNTE
ncbi:hypothetical protein, partial [Paraclostridium sp. AKS81]|uniref:hypothetical protein n=1 Tax=Paraclostridium sp. AKS81 TaxID=2876117 RepID=UPI0021E0A7EC